MKVIAETDGLSAVVAKALKISRQAISQWRRVPAERVLTVAPLIGLSPHQIRPDIYPE